MDTLYISVQQEMDFEATIINNCLLSQVCMILGKVNLDLAILPVKTIS